MVQECDFPARALLLGYSGGGGYVDCFSAATDTHVSLPQFIEIFYTSWLFRLERLVLALAARASSDQHAAELAAGKRSTFAAWEVELRTDSQLLMRDITGRTRSWFMVDTAEGGTRLYFGSAITPVVHDGDVPKTIGPVYRALIGPHKIYSRALLAVALKRLQQH